MKIERDGQVLGICELDDLSAATEEAFRRKVWSALDGRTTIEIDLSRTQFMDCRGLGTLIALRTAVRARKGTVCLLNPTPPVRLLLDLTGVGSRFEVVTSRGNPYRASEAILPHGSREGIGSACYRRNAACGATDEHRVQLSSPAA